MRYLTTTTSPWLDFDRLFDDLSARTVFSPATEIVESADHILLSMDLPGMKKEDIHIDIEGDTLTVSGERKREQREERANYQRYERAYGTFKRSFTLPTIVDVDKVEARYENGVLELQLPKAEAAKPRRITVQ